MRAYSQDWRERVLRALDQGKAQKEIVEALGVSLATIKHYIGQRPEVGHVKPKAIPGRPPKKAEQLEAGLVAQLESHRDATLEQQCELWEQTHGVRVSPRTMSRAIKQVGWTRKKVVGRKSSATKRNEASGVSR